MLQAIALLLGSPTSGAECNLIIRRCRCSVAEGNPIPSLPRDYFSFCIHSSHLIFDMSHLEDVKILRLKFMTS